jgi:hypothetical protein
MTRVTLTVKIVANKKRLIIPSLYYDLFKVGVRYQGLLCTNVGRYRVLSIPPVMEDQFLVGEQYEIEVPPNPPASPHHGKSTHV